MRNERYDYHVDMWALGCICFELVTLNLPFTARSLLDLVFQVVETEPDWSMWTSASEELRDVASRLLRKDVLKRPTSMSILQEPLFAAPLEPSEEMWALVAHDTAEHKGVEETGTVATGEMNREEFQTMLSTYNDTCGRQLREELQAATNSAGSGAASTGGSTVSRLLHEGLGIPPQVPETIV
jgi:serine/threonine protein kinase